MTKVIFFDFDGVILDSMPIRDYGFRKIFETYDKNLVEKLIVYHQYNAGLSRFHKIKYFYNKILQIEIDDNKIQNYADKFSDIMKKELTNKKYLIKETVEFISKNNNKVMHIVSGSEQNELRFLCNTLDISHYFKSIHGSPTPKNDLVKKILDEEKYNTNECILIGDSINDYEAAIINKIQFYGYNNELLKTNGNYIQSFKDFHI